MTHLYLCLIDGGGHIHHLLHEVLVRHLQILLLGLLVFTHGLEGAYLEGVGNVLMAGTRERRRCPLLIEHLCLLLLLVRVLILDHHVM